jgi:linoleate 10R-lipoxygenase
MVAESPNLGHAGQPYSRTVPSSSIPTKLPNPNDIFDQLLKRVPREPKDSDASNVRDPNHHPGGLSAMSFVLANLVIHSIFIQTRRTIASTIHPLMSL